jgi:hypothetical protein
MIAVLRRCPFTVLMVATMIVVGVYGQTHVGALDSEVRQQVDYSVRLLLQGHLHRLVTSLFFTVGGLKFYSSLLLFAACVGWAETVYGTRHALLAFFGLHLATLLLLAFVIWPLVVLETQHGTWMLDERDVGPSAGYYGCLGLAVAGLAPFAKRRSVVIAITCVLSIRFVWSMLQMSNEGHEISADAAHLLAFPLGLLSYRLISRPVEPNQ